MRPGKAGLGMEAFGIRLATPARPGTWRKEFGVLIHLRLTRVPVRRMVALEGQLS